MAYSVANRAVEQDSVVSYSKAKIYGSWSYTDQSSQVTTTFTEAWQHRRFRRKEYKYVGLSYADAQSVATDATEYYSRVTYQSVLSTSGTTAGTFVDEQVGNVMFADVSINFVGGDLWEVRISVREEDVKLSRSPVESSGLFGVENLRKYDTNADTPFSNT